MSGSGDASVPILRPRRREWARHRAAALRL